MATAPSQARYGNPANYNAIPATRTSGDASALEVDVNGNLLVSLATALSGLVSGAENDTVLVAPYQRSDAFLAIYNSSDASTAAQVKAATSAKSIYLTDIVISVDTAMNVKIQDDTGTPVIYIEPLYLPANSVWSKTFTTPIKWASNKPMMVKASVSGNISVTATGYVI